MPSGKPKESNLKFCKTCRFFAPDKDYELRECADVLKACIHPDVCKAVNTPICLKYDKGDCMKINAKNACAGWLRKV